jgi:dihydroorotate dehydrogenase (fumarate)
VGVDQTAYERAGYVAALEQARHTYGDLRPRVNIDQ